MPPVPTMVVQTACPMCTLPLQVTVSRPGENLIDVRPVIVAVRLHCRHGCQAATGR